MPYIYTPKITKLVESSNPTVLAESSNPAVLVESSNPAVLVESFNPIVQEVKEKNWVVTVDGKHGALLADVSRDVTLNGISYSGQKKEDIIEAATNMAGNRELFAKLAQHYNQSLHSFPLVTLSPAISGSPIGTLRNLYQHEDKILLKSICTDLTVHLEDPNRHFFVPGEIEVNYEWDHEQGFRLTELKFSNRFLQDRSLQIGTGTNTELTEKQLQEHIEGIYKEETLKASQQQKEIIAAVRQLQKNNMSDQHLLTLCNQILHLTLEQIRHPEMSNEDKETRQFKYASLASDLAFLCPKEKALSKKMMPLDTQYEYASKALLNTLQGLDSEDARVIAVHDLRRVLDDVNVNYPGDKVLTTQLLWRAKDQMDTTISEAAFGKSHQDTAIQLAEQISRRPWGKIAAYAMLALVTASILALCIATAGGAAITIPLIAWGLSYLVPTAVVSAGLSLTGIGMFSKSLPKNTEPKEKTKALLNVVAEVNKGPPAA